MVGVDIETTGLDFNRDKIIGVGVGNKFSQAGLVYLASAVFHNGKFDIKFLWRSKVTVNFVFDTMLAASLLTDRPQYLDLATLAQHFLGETTWKEEVDRKNMANEDIAKVAAYCLKDVAMTEKLAVVLEKKLREQGLYEFFVEKIMPAARMLTDVEYRGMRLALDQMDSTKQTLASEIALLSEKLITTLGPINLNSPKQLLPALNKLGINPRKYDGKPTTDKTALKALRGSHPAIDLLLDYKQKSKLLSFIDSWKEAAYEGRLYPSYNMCKGPQMGDDSGARTGRLSCSNPNLQQIPREKLMRSLFIPSEGNIFVIADESQIEPRILAHYSDDPALKRDFNSGLDPYGSFAVDVLGARCHPNEVKDQFPLLRAVAKECILSIVYGIGARRLSERIKTQTGQAMSENEARTIINSYFRKRPRIKALRDRVENAILDRHAKEGAGYVTTLYGRKVLIDVEKIFSTGVNSIIQSTASDICLFSQLPLVDNAHGFKLVALVHDEVIWEGPPENAENFKRDLEVAMTTAVERELNLTVPLKVEAVIAKSWAEKK